MKFGCVFLIFPFIYFFSLSHSFYLCLFPSDTTHIHLYTHIYTHTYRHTHSRTHTHTWADEVDVAVWVVAPDNVNVHIEWDTLDKN